MMILDAIPFLEPESLESIASEKPNESRIVMKRFQVGIALHMIDVVITKLERPLQRRQGRLGHPKDRIAACKIVPRNRTLGMKPNESAVNLQSSGEQPLGGEIVRVNAERVGVERISLKNLAEKLQLEIELALLSKSPGGGFRRLSLEGGIARTFMGCGHVGRRSLPGLGITKHLPSQLNTMARTQ